MQQSQYLGKAETESLGRLLGLAGVALGLQDQQTKGDGKAKIRPRIRTHVKELGKGGETKCEPGEAHQRH